MRATRVHRLTVREIQAAPTGDHRDGAGLLLRVRPEGSASWVLEFTAPSGRVRQMGLGGCPRDTLPAVGDSLRAARRAAADARELVRRGADPIEDRQRRRDAARAADAERRAEVQRSRWTLARSARDYCERVIEPHRSTRHALEWIGCLERHLPPALMSTPIDAIDAPTLLEALRAAEPVDTARRHRDLGETLKRVRQRLEAVFEDAQFHGRCAGNPAAAIKRKLTLERPRGEPEPMRALPWRELPAFMARLRAMPGTAPRALELLVLTASRTAEVLGMRWDELAPRSGSALWTIPGNRMKGGEDHRVPLSPRAVEIVTAQRGQSAELVFPSTQPSRRNKPLSNMSLLAVLDRLGMRDRTTAHGLRASFSTWANETGAARPDVVEACLAHREADRVRRAYNRADFEAERAELLRRWGEFLAGVTHVSSDDLHVKNGKEAPPPASGT